MSHPNRWAMVLPNFNLLRCFLMYLKSFINQYFPGVGAIGGSMLLRVLTPNFSYLNSSSQLVDDRSLPLYEVALLYMLARIGNESQIEREVVDAGYLHR